MTSSRRRTAAAPLALLAGALLAVAPLAAQQVSDATATVVVEVPVQVVRDGQPVRGLGAADFAVYDGRQKQAITGFEVIDLATVEAAEVPQMSQASRRHFLFLFDLAFSDPTAVVKAREAAMQVVAELHPSDLVAVATYTSHRGPELALAFTPDRRQIAAAIATFGDSKLLGRTADPLRLVVARPDTPFGELTGLDPAGGSGRGPAGTGDEGSELLKTIVERAEQAERRAAQTAVQDFTRSFADLGRMMGNIDGRKYVVLLSEGFDSQLLQGATDPSRRDELSAASTSGELWNVNSEELYGDTSALNAVERMLEELRRADCTVQAVDIGGLRAGGGQQESGKDTLLNLAKSTGGELFENVNDLAGAMGAMLERTGVTYVLAFQPPGLEWDGSYHRLRVELVGQPRGSRVIARPGYYAPEPYAERDSLERLLDAQAQVVTGADAGTLDVAVLAAPFAMPGRKAYVPVLLEVAGSTLLAGHLDPALPLELFVYAFDRSGVIQDFLVQTVGLEVPKVQAALVQSGVKFFGHLELPPGDYDLRVLVRNGSTGESGLRVVPLAVPEFASAEAVLLPGFVPEPAGRWLIVREQPRGDYQEAPYPFLLGGEPYVPAARPELQPGQPARVALVGWSLAPGALRARARVLDGSGRDLGKVTLQRVERETGEGADRLVATLVPPALPAGQYHLEVSLAGTAPGAPAETSRMAFVVR